MVFYASEVRHDVRVGQQLVAASVKLMDTDASKKEVNVLETRKPSISVLAESFNVIMCLDVRGNIFIEVSTLGVSLVSHLSKLFGDLHT